MNETVALTVWTLGVAFWYAIPAWVAWRRGYPVGDWLTAFGCLGVLVLLILPPVRPDTPPPLRDRRLRFAHRIAILLVLANILAIVLLVSAVHVLNSDAD